MIAILNRKLSRSKNREWHGFISDESENIDKNYELKKHVLSFYKKIFYSCHFVPRNGVDRFHCHTIKNNKSKTNQPMEKATKNKTVLQVVGPCVSPNFRYSS